MTASRSFPRTILRVVAGAALAASLAAAPANAQVFGAAPYVPTPDPAIERLQSRIESLESELRKSTGQIEQLSLQLTTARRAADAAAKDAAQSRTQYDQALAALTQRVQQLETLATGGDVSQLPGRASAESAAAGTKPEPRGDAAASQAAADGLPADEEGMMKGARTLLLQGDYAAAQKGFASFIQKHPKSKLTPDAQYYLGESLLIQENYSEAVDAYGKLLSKYPKSDKAPDGLVKLARSLRLLGKKKQACEMLKELPKTYPKASAVTKGLADTERSRSGC